MAQQSMKKCRESDVEGRNTSYNILSLIRYLNTTKLAIQEISAKHNEFTQADYKELINASALSHEITDIFDQLVPVRNTLNSKDVFPPTYDKPQDTEQWTLVKHNKHAETPLLPQVSTGFQIAPVCITPALSLNATIIPSIEYVSARGVLYYIYPINHFAMNIDGFLFHGNIGVIVERGLYSKIDDCNNKQCTMNCPFYHDPLLYHGSMDIRNYSPDCWTYMNKNGGRIISPQYKRCKKIGSIHALDIDIHDVNKLDIIRYGDQLMHDLLCLLVAKRLIQG